MRSCIGSTGAVPALAAALCLGIVAASPRPAHADDNGAVLEPRLDEIEVQGETATAPLPDGTVAELTLDATLQRAAVRLLAAAHPESGAVIAVDPRRGRVLAWAGVRGSEPAPSVVATTLAPAASLFKIVTTTALLEKHVDPDLTVCIEGGSSGIELSHLHRPRTGRALCGPFREALGRSRNAVFAQLVTRFLHRGDIVDTAARFGFNEDAALDVPVPMGSLTVPEGALPFARASAGFVGSRLSAVGALQLATTVAAGGRMLRLHLVERTEDTKAPAHRELLGRVMREETARELRRMMEVTISGGTCLGAFTDESGKNYLGDVRAAGKTGTLQPNEDDPTSSWFVGFAPSRRPKVVISVLLDNGPIWRRKANEVGRDLLRVYFATRGYRGVTMPAGL